MIVCYLLQSIGELPQGVVNEGKTLRIASVTPQMAGKYTCRVHNEQIDRRAEGYTTLDVLGNHISHYMHYILKEFDLR